MKTFCNKQMQMCIADLANVRLNYIVFLAEEVHTQQEFEKRMAMELESFLCHRQMTACTFAGRDMQYIEKSL